MQVSFFGSSSIRVIYVCVCVCVLFQLMPFVLRVSICFCCFSANEHCDEAVPLVLCGESVLLCLFFPLVRITSYFCGLCSTRPVRD